MKKKLVSILLIIMTILSTGCWNQRELNDLGIAMALGLDKADDKHIRLTVQIVLPQEVKQPSYFTPVTVYSEEAETVFEAFRKITTMSPRKVYLPHFRIAVIGETLAQDGILDLLEMLFRDHEFRSDFYIVVAREGASAEDVLKTMTPFERIPANEKFSALKLSESAWAPTVAVNLDDLLRNLATDGMESVLTGITFKGNKNDGKTKKNVETLDPNSLLQYEGIGVFKEDKLVGWLNQDESKGFNYIMSNVQSTVGRIKCPTAGELVVEIMGTETEIIPSYIDGKPEFELKITSNVNVAEVVCDIDLQDPKTIEQLEKSLEDRQKELLNSVVVAAQEKYKSDIFGFGNTFRKSYPKQWKKLKDQWEELFPTVKVSYSAEGTINLTGTMNQSIFEK
ncbi:Ger(x)C family spore germination protein [Anaerobacillus isosaccharinicus]|uniref:Ger(X)C family spore germination protein n=1 Tax=Anaerobacillus isosaccharinicus TaxID=1532552 RepID=A0A7S7L8H0_9BACI|nr:Ger(x)C family spore germination protein [Anaerobacillus isosaccharinicus]MBA5585233.1 Ger(x)C family spore germination protein [Anaerobacillus isosaccharinicus]QOY36433.1 Ger(x)C family spore germination protein [Anaerobacillus isosaccharinicus]